MSSSPARAAPRILLATRLRTATGLLVHMIGVGLPSALLTRRAHPA